MNSELLLPTWALPCTCDDEVNPFCSHHGDQSDLQEYNVCDG